MKTSVTVRVLALAAVVCAFGAGCGDNENVNIDLSGATSTPHRTPSPGVRTSTPVRTATSAAATATPGGPTATAGGPTATAGGPTSTAGGPTASPSPGAGAAAAKVATDDLLPFLTASALATTANVPTSASPQEAAEAQNAGIPDAANGTANCPDGGTRTEVDAPPTITITLAACKVMNGLGTFQFDGTIVATLPSSATFNVTVLVGSKTITYMGTITGGPNGSGGFVVNGGPITIHTSAGDLTLTANMITIDSTGHFVSGSGTITDPNNIVPGLKQIVVTINSGGQTANVVATFDDNTTGNFVLNLKTGALTPA